MLLTCVVNRYFLKGPNEHRLDQLYRQAVQQGKTVSEQELVNRRDYARWIDQECGYVGKWPWQAPTQQEINNRKLYLSW